MKLSSYVLGLCLTSLLSLPAQAQWIKDSISAITGGRTAKSSLVTDQEIDRFLESLQNVPRVGDEEMNDVRDRFQPGIDPGLIQIDGGWTGGGGEGIACFANETEASRAIDERGRIREGYRQKIRGLISADLFEYSNQLSFVPPLRGENADAYVLRVIVNYIMPVSPYLGQRLLETTALLNPAPAARVWNSTGNRALLKINDSGPRAQAIPKGCRPLQLVVRYAQHSSGKYPRIFIDYDQDLYERFVQLSQTKEEGVASQGALILHEMIYAMGAEIGMRDSSATRALTAHLLSNSLWGALNAAPPTARLSGLTSTIYGLGFRDISWLYVRPGQVSARPYTKASRQIARARLSRVYEETYNQMRSSGFGVGPINNSVISFEQELRFIDRLAAAIGPEEAFLFLAANEFNAGRSSTTVDALLTDLVDDRRAIGDLCRHLQTRLAISKSGKDKAFVTEGLAVMHENSLTYCSGAMR